MDPVVQSVSVLYLYSSIQQLDDKVVRSRSTRSKYSSWTLSLSISCPEKEHFNSIHLGGCFIINWYVIEITGQSAGTARIQIHSLLYHQQCQTRQQCRVASLLESPCERLFANLVGAWLRQVSAHLWYRPYDSEIKRLMLKRLSLPGRSIVVISDSALHSSYGAVGLHVVLIQQYAVKQCQSCEFVPDQEQLLFLNPLTVYFLSRKG